MRKADGQYVRFRTNKVDAAINVMTGDERVADRGATWLVDRRSSRSCSRGRIIEPAAQCALTNGTGLSPVVPSAHTHIVQLLLHEATETFDDRAR
jgi:hypothetical protein